MVLRVQVKSGGLSMLRNTSVEPLAQLGKLSQVNSMLYLGF